MAKYKVYLRIAKSRGPKGYKVAAAVRPNYQPLTVGSGWNEKPVATAAFAAEFDIPDEIFKRAEQVLAELELHNDDVRIAVDVGDEDDD